MRGLSEAHNIWFGRVGELYVNKPFRLNYREPTKTIVSRGTEQMENFQILQSGSNLEIKIMKRKITFYLFPKLRCCNSLFFKNEKRTLTFL